MSITGTSSWMKSEPFLKGHRRCTRPWWPARDYRLNSELTALSIVEVTAITSGSHSSMQSLVAKPRLRMNNNERRRWIDFRMWRMRHLLLKMQIHPMGAFPSSWPIPSGLAQTCFIGPQCFWRSFLSVSLAASRQDGICHGNVQLTPMHKSPRRLGRFPCCPRLPDPAIWFPRIRSMKRDHKD